MGNYINNAVFSAEFGAWAAIVREARANGTPPPPMSDNIGAQILLIAEKVSLKPNFRHYTWREDMVADAVLQVVKYAHNFNLEKSNNAFSWVTQCVFNAMIRYIQIERKATYTTMLYSESVDHPAIAICRETNAEHEAFNNWKTKVQTKTISQHRQRTPLPSRIAEVGKLYEQGLTAEEIALRLGQSSRSVKTCISRYLTKKGVSKVPAPKSEYWGVSWMRPDRRWTAQITVKGKRHFLGNYDDEKDAARAYDRAVIQFGGSKNKLNFPEALSTAA